MLGSATQKLNGMGRRFKTPSQLRFIGAPARDRLFSETIAKQTFQGQDEGERLGDEFLPADDEVDQEIERGLGLVGASRVALSR